MYNQTIKNCQCHCSSLCNSIFCNSNGVCEKSKCNCQKGFYGERCEFKTKSKSFDTDDELVEDENKDKNQKQNNNNKSSKNIAFILVLALVLFALLFIVVSFIFHKRFLFKRQFQARQFYNNEFDEFNLNMENIEISDPVYRILNNEEDEQVNITFNEDTNQNGENINLINESKNIINTSIDDYPTTSSTLFKDKTSNKPIYIKKSKKLKPKSPHNINI